jgi:phosphonatase-like hydrolase
MGLYKPEAIRILLSQLGKPATDELVRRLHDDFSRRMQDYYAHDPAVRPLAGANEAFRRLRAAGVRVALNTGFGRDIMDVILDRVNWRDAVDATICSDEVARGRPAPDMIRALAARFGIAEPAQIAKVGDTLADIDEGLRAGCGLVIGVLTGTGVRDEFAARPGIAVAPDVSAAAGMILQAPTPGQQP